jgi:hypothetical protein
MTYENAAGAETAMQAEEFTQAEKNSVLLQAALL